MKNHPIMTLSLMLGLASFGAAQEARPRAVPPLKEHGPGSEKLANFRISFKISANGLEASGSFVVRDRSQSNYVSGGETPYATGDETRRAVDFKKHGVIVNCIPYSAGDAVSMTCQFELSGALPAEGPLGTRSVESVQFQSEFTMRRGETLVLVDGPEKRIEVSLDEVPTKPAPGTTRPPSRP